jgi:hypothetical protein
MHIDNKTKDACKLIDAITSAIALPDLYSRKAKEMAAVEVEYMLKVEDDDCHEVLRAYLALLRKE